MFLKCTSYRPKHPLGQHTDQIKQNDSVNQPNDWIAFSDHFVRKHPQVFPSKKDVDTVPIVNESIP
jgi:hypothetical protein